MAKRGRKVPEDQGAIIPGRRRERLEPPAELEEPERVIWNSIVVNLPPDWFGPESQPLLKELCRHLRHADDLSREISEVRRRKTELAQGSLLDADSLKELRRLTIEYRELLRAHALQSERAGNLAVKLRVTVQSKIAVDSAAKKARDMPIEDPPWLDWQGAVN